MTSVASTLEKVRLNEDVRWNAQATSSATQNAWIEELQKATTIKKVVEELVMDREICAKEKSSTRTSPIDDKS